MSANKFVIVIIRMVSPKEVQVINDLLDYK